MCVPVQLIVLNAHGSLNSFPSLLFCWKCCGLSLTVCFNLILIRIVSGIFVIPFVSVSIFHFTSPVFLCHCLAEYLLLIYINTSETRTHQTTICSVLTYKRRLQLLFSLHQLSSTLTTFFQIDRHCQVFYFHFTEHVKGRCMLLNIYLVHFYIWCLKYVLQFACVWQRMSPSLSVSLTEGRPFLEFSCKRFLFWIFWPFLLVFF